jgi:hypothetical protein
MSDVADIMKWVLAIEAIPKGTPHQLLRITDNASRVEIQAAFHIQAKQSHPDLFRNTLTPPQMERLTKAYARMAEAYAALAGRSRRRSTSSGLASSPAPVSLASPASVAALASVVAESNRHRAPTVNPPTQALELPRTITDRQTASSPSGPAAQMNAKALPYFRRAELALKKGDLAAARFNLRLAVAADPTSVYLRGAVTEVESGGKLK